MELWEVVIVSDIADLNAAREGLSKLVGEGARVTIPFELEAGLTGGAHGVGHVRNSCSRDSKPANQEVQSLVGHR